MSKWNKSPAGKAYMRKYARQNKDRFDAHKQAWRLKNPNYWKEYRSKHRERLVAKDRAYYQANKAKWKDRQKSLTDEDRERKRAANRDRYRVNPGKRRKMNERWKQANLARFRELQAKHWAKIRDLINASRRAKYRQDPSYAATVRGKSKEWYDNNPERASASRREYDRKHPEVRRDIFSRRKARIRSATIGDKKAIREFYKWVATATVIMCHWCGKLVPMGSRTVDHVVPIAKGGAHSVSNCVPCCRRCNCRKSAKLPHEFKP